MNQPMDLTNELSKTASDVLEVGVESVANNVALNIDTISQTMRARISAFRQKFNAAFLNFAEEAHLDMLKQAVEPDFEQGIEVKLNSTHMHTTEADELAAVMMEGFQLLNEIRAILTGTTIQTHFYYKSEKGIIPVHISNLKPVLSLYNASGTLSNPVNLAFEINGEIIDLSGELQQDQTDYDITHYLTIIDRAKDEYVNWLNSKAQNKSYTKYWDSKDAEILELLIQRKAKTLAKNHYRRYREVMGSSGKQTTLLQMGDIGSIQVKYFGQKQKQVNVMRFSMLRNKLAELETIFTMQNPVAQKQQLKQIFLPKTSEMHDEFSKQLNRSATEYFNSLFK